MATKSKKVEIAKQKLDNICFELGLKMRLDPQRKDYIISKDNIYLFRASVYRKYSYFGIRFGTRQSCNYNYDDQKVEELVNKILEERGVRKHSNGTDYSRDKHLI